MATTMNPDRWRLLEQVLASPEPERPHDRDGEPARPPRRPGLAANHRSLRDYLRRDRAR